MKIVLNGKVTETGCETLVELLAQLDYAGETVATAVDGTFIPRQQRDGTTLVDGMAVEIVAPIQGG